MRGPMRGPGYVPSMETQFSSMDKAAFLARIRSLQINLRQILQETKDTKLGTTIGHKLYPEFVDVKKELSRRAYPSHSVDIFLHVCREMVDTYKARNGKGMTLKTAASIAPRAKLMDVIKKWESDGVFEEDTFGEEAKSQQMTKCEDVPRGQELGKLKEEPGECDTKFGIVQQTEVSKEEAMEKEGTEDNKEAGSGAKGTKRKAKEQPQIAVSHNFPQKKLKGETSSLSEMEQTQEAGNENSVLSREGNEDGLKGEGGECATIQLLQEENVALRAQVDLLIQILETRDQQIAKLLFRVDSMRFEKGAGENNEEQEVIRLLVGEIDSSIATRMSRDGPFVREDI